MSRDTALLAACAAGGPGGWDAYHDAVRQWRADDRAWRAEHAARVHEELGEDAAPDRLPADAALARLVRVLAEGMRTG